MKPFPASRRRVLPTALLGLLALTAEATVRAAPPDFAADVAPILARRCLACHSHAAGTMEGGLALDWRSGWEQGGSRGPAIVPGSAATSLLATAIRHGDPGLRMPEERLPDREIAILEAWIDSGAADPRVAPPAPQTPGDFWSLLPLERPPVPVPPAGTAAANPIDAFLDAANDAAGIAPAPEADRRTFIRRATIGLHGLPPTPEEVEAFVADASPGAHERLVDRLLASPRLGERFARHWLDCVHYADSHGFEHDVFRPNAWPYRDWVIGAFNADMPWPTFVRAQLAADALFPGDAPMQAALGFLGAGTYDHSAAATAPRSFENLDRDDMVTQTLQALASTTANCARCHAHKFDPVSQEDYYALQAVFAGVGKGEIDWEPDAAVAGERRRWNRLADMVRSSPAALLDEPEAALVAEWEGQGRSLWTAPALASFTSAFAADLARQADGSILSGGTAPEREVVTLTVRGPRPAITGVRLDLLPDDSLPERGPGRAPNGNLHLSEVELRLFPAEGIPRAVAIARASADFNQEGWTIDHAIDGKPATAWGIHPEEGKPHHAVFVLAERLSLDEGDTLAIVLRQLHGGAHVIGRFRLTLTDGNPEGTLALPTEAEAALSRPAEARTRDERTALAAAVVGARAADELRRLPPPRKLYAAAVTAMNERGTITIDPPREIRLLHRGDVDQPREPVGPGALSAVAGLPARFEIPAGAPESARRAALADWLVAPSNPLVWRSIANRVWQWHFGRGLCDTPNDFGRMGSLPSHPELLDWLACELRDSSSLHRLHRLICTSRAYRRSSATTSEAFAADPDGRLLARMPRPRVDAETFFDGVLLASGLLDGARGGPGVARFTQRPGAQLTPILDYDAFDLASPGAGRRAIYRVVWRGIPDPLFDALDFPDLGLLAPTRGFSASALQSLVLANNRFVLHAARALEARAETETGDLAGRVRFIVRRVWLREPEGDELADLVALAERHGLAAVARALFNSDEFLFVD
jgi:hypothetical protein